MKVCDSIKDLNYRYKGPRTFVMGGNLKLFPESGAYH